MNGSENTLFYKLLALKNLMKLNTSVILSSRIVKGLNEKEVKRIIDFLIKSRNSKKNIVGVYFYGATRYGRFDIENGEMNWFNLYKLIEEATDTIASLEYFIEFKKFLLLLHKAGKNLNMILPFGSGGFMGLFQAGSIKRAIEINQLKKINNEMEDGKYLHALRRLYKLKWFKQLLKRVPVGLLLRFPFEYFTLPSQLFLIGFGNVSTPANFSSYFLEVPELFNIKGKSPIFVRALNYRAPEPS
jgi:hypothetical protein